MTKNVNAVENHNNHVYNPGECLRWLIVQCNDLVKDGTWKIGTERQIAICRGAVLEVSVDACDEPSKKALVEYNISINDKVITLDQYRSIEAYCQSVWHDEYESISPEQWYSYVEC